MMVYFAMNFESCCDDALSVLEKNMDVLRKFNYSYLQVEFEMVLSRFFQDVYKEKQSLVYPRMSMDSPENCTALLKMYLGDEVKRAIGLKDEDQTWELHPHSYFYSVEGEHERNIFTKPTNHIETKVNPTVDKEKKEICLWNLGSQLEVDMSNGKGVECRNKDLCSRIRKTLQSTRRKEAKETIDRMNNGKLKTSFESKLSSATDFKKFLKIAK